MNKRIWFTEGLSSQKDVISCVKHLAHAYPGALTVFASHRYPRNEILSAADHACLEPQSADARFPFIESMVREHGISVIHSGKNSLWYESQRERISALGVRLTTGATGARWFEMADDKVSFARFMEQNGLPVVPSLIIESAQALRQALADAPFGDLPVCIKPVRGIYGMGFWRFDSAASPMSALYNPDKRRIHPDLYLHAMAQEPAPEPMVFMPYLPGPEYSVDILAEDGEPVAAVARRKEGSHQYLENSGAAYELALACARCLHADGLVNVQTRNDQNGNPLLLEINLRPSGGIGYTRFSGVNLPGLFALRQADIIDRQEAANMARAAFKPAVVRSFSDVQPYDETLHNLVVPS
ncbi:ATP-grasp domain-containing protein [Enterobacillus tribolii]|uniref:ATP-grasp domain-containing protein n=1 Tax=Enterobacillus tribolii TaxID=1487935 RepID=A0A370R1K3_9GAMM|nr:ATP-grasp domain-containing protein [Enterobacillus tribolii]MBW7983095.1 carbamoyl-phosphate synthase large chain [Enterobacillus tribolii]RDK95801.1 ATP-grasp domain-containing protein [Enterobacillus tribolii]